MNYQEKTQEFIEGRLDVEEEDAFFEALSSDKAIRSDFKESFALELGMLRDASEINPSNRLTGALFTSLGIGATVVSNPIRDWLMNNSKPIISALIASIITTAAFVLSDFRKNVNDAKEISFTESKRLDLLSTDSLNIYILSQKSEEDSSENLLSNRTIVDKGTATNNKIYSYLGNEEKPDENTSNIDYANDKRINSTSYSHNINQSEIHIQNQIINRDEFVSPSIKLGTNLDTPLLPNISSDNILDNFSIKISKFSDFIYPSKELGIKPNDDSDFRNSSISLIYELSDNIDVGFDFRRENVYQEFTATEGENTVNYFQYPSVNSYGLFLSFDLVQLFERGIIYSDLNLGGNSAIAIGRGGIGFKFDLGKYYYLDFGIQQCYYIFTNEGRFFNNTKTSLYGGLTFEL